jgi:DNA-binding PadR family transcriptional regulator
MYPSSIPGVDLREAFDGLREAIDSRLNGFTRSENELHRDIRSAVLIELSVEPMHGYQIIRAIEARSGGTWTPTAGAVYPTLQLLADEGLVVSVQTGERKIYSLTEAGKAAAAGIADDDHPRTSPRGRATQGTVNLTKSGVKLAQALSQVAQNGTAEQSERASAIIDEARRKLYAILAED